MKNAEKWYTKTRPNDVQGLVIDEETGRNVAVTYDAKDARLVAAAPALLSVLKAVYNCDDANEALPDHILRDVEAALNAAEGD